MWYVNGGGVCKPPFMGTSQLDRGLFLWREQPACPGGWDKFMLPKPPPGL